MTQQRDNFPFAGFVLNFTPLFGALGDLRPHPEPEELTSDYARAAYQRRALASPGRWVSLVLTIAIAVTMVLGKPVLAPLLILVAWPLLTARLTWRRGANAGLREMASSTRLGWWALSFSLAAVWASLVGVLFPAPFWAAVATVCAAVAGLLALADAPLTAKALRAAQAPEPFDETDYRLVAGVMKMTPTAYERGLADGAFSVQRDALGRIVAQIPPGSDGLLETPSELEERVRVKAPDWMVGYADPATDVLILEPVDDETRAQRDAVARSGGLFAEHIGGGLDGLPVIDLSQGLGNQPLPRL